jgi:glycosidase
VIGDLTTNHTGSGHDWFRKALADRHLPEASFYRIDGDRYERWLGVASLPKLDHSSATLRRRLYQGEDSVAAQWLRAGLDGWPSLDSHDTPRFRTITGGGTSGWIDREGRGRGRHLAGLALQMTLPGVATIFMGDEIGLTAVDGEHARTPFPWHLPQEWDAETLSAYQAWITVRADHVALRRGGLRWVHVGTDSVTFLREHPAQRLLVHIGRADHAPVEIPLRSLGLRRPKQVLTVTGEAVRPVDSAEHGLPAIRLPGSGPAAHVYQLPVI